jgi:5'-3' exoribonuclease 1
LKFDYDFERILDDFILLALFVGNDFLPHLPSLHINEGALDLMFKTYKEILPNCDGYIQDAGRVDLSRLQKLLDALSSIVEKQSFEAESMDTLYLSGKRPDGLSDRQLLHQMEQKKRNNQKGKVITDEQQQVYLRIKDALVNTPKVRSVNFDRGFKASDKKFLKELGRDLNMTFRVVHNPEDRSTNVLFEYDTDDDSEPESELDEEAMFARDRVLNKYDRAEIIPANMTKEDIKREEDEKLDTVFKQWKADYYMEKMHIDINNQEQMDGLIGSYIIGIQWVLKYYYDGVASWGWFYPYHYCPKISDLVNIARFQDYPFELGQPFKPFEQLMGVLPSLSKKLLPRAYQTLMTETTSPILDFYPTDFNLDMNGKKQDWEAVVKIPFIEEKRLLDAMKSREGQLTSEEKSMSRIGTSWRIFFDKKIAQMDMDDIPSYKSPLPGVFPDIHHCLASEMPYNLPTLDNGLGLRKGLLPGTKLGRDALPGFPSLETVPYSYEIKGHQVHVFQQDSRNESVVISINNRYTISNIEDLAKLFLYRNIYVHYPYLQEAVVIGVSTAEKKYYIKFHNGKKQIREHYWDDKEVGTWKQQMGRAEYVNSKRFGLIVGEIEVGFHVCILNGMRQTEDGALVKEFVNPSMEDLVPIQMVVVKVNNPDPRFFEKPPAPIEEKFPMGSSVFFLGTRFLGKQATIVGYSDSQVDIEMLISTDKNYQSEPNFGHTAVNKQEREVHYSSLQDIARELRVRPLPLSRLTSNICVLDKGGKRVNMGLDLKSGARDQKVLGYSRKNPAGYWEFSSKAVELIKDFVEKFPQFVAMLDQKNSEMMSIYDFDWVEDKNKECERMKEWRAVHKIKQMEKTSFETEELEEVRRMMCCALILFSNL